MGQLPVVAKGDQDLDLEAQVKRYLHSRNFPSLRHLMVEVRQGCVTLTGTVCSFYERQIALSVIPGVVGVSKLIDRIVVRDVRSTV